MEIRINKEITDYHFVSSPAPLQQSALLSEYILDFAIL